MKEDDFMEMNIDYILHDACLKSQSASFRTVTHGAYDILWQSIGPWSFMIAFFFAIAFVINDKRPPVSIR